MTTVTTVLTGVNFALFAFSLITCAINIKILTEIYKEKTIARRYEKQSPDAASGESGFYYKTESKTEKTIPTKVRR